MTVDGMSINQHLPAGNFFRYPIRHSQVLRPARLTQWALGSTQGADVTHSCWANVVVIGFGVVALGLVVVVLAEVEVSTRLDSCDVTIAVGLRVPLGEWAKVVFGTLIVVVVVSKLTEDVGWVVLFTVEVSVIELVVSGRVVEFVPSGKLIDSGSSDETRIGWLVEVLTWSEVSDCSRIETGRLGAMVVMVESTSVWFSNVGSVDAPSVSINVVPTVPAISSVIGVVSTGGSLPVTSWAKPASRINSHCSVWKKTTDRLFVFDSLTQTRSTLMAWMASPIVTLLFSVPNHESFWRAIKVQ